MKNKGFSLILVLSVSLFFLWGCEFNREALTGTSNDSETLLMYVEISFSDNEHLYGYVKTLGLEKDVKILVGGASVNNLYDKDGIVIATFNYARVNYIKIISEPITSDT